jgi:aldehyde:ferredoxin oxidoreductase
MSILDMGEPLGPDPLLQPEALDPFGDYDRKGDIYAKGSAYYQLLSSAGLCALYCQFYTPPVVELIRPVTGWDLDWKEGLEIGKRILTLRQAFNAREGVRPDDFQLPERFKTPLGMGPTAGQDVPFTTLKERYFTSMGWDPETGVPLPETMAALEVG